MNKRLLLIITCYLAISVTLFAPNAAKTEPTVATKLDTVPKSLRFFEQFYFDILVHIANPVDEFDQNVPGVGIGLAGKLGATIMKTPLSVGLSFGGTYMGSKSRDIPYSYYSDSVTVREKTTSSIGMGHVFLRLQPPKWRIKPYADGLIGFRYFSTKTSIERIDNTDDDEEIAANVNLSDYALSYGFGFGVRFLLANKEITTNTKTGKNKKNAAFSLNAGVQYLRGTEAEYLNVSKAGAIEVSDPADGPVKTTLHPSKSETNMWTFQIGLGLGF